MKILLATKNIHKVQEITDILHDYMDGIVSLNEFPGLPDPVEDGATFYENSLKKAMHYYRLTGLSTLADDSGLIIDALGGEPGIYSARYIDPALTFPERSRIILERLKEVPLEKRGARFCCCCVIVWSADKIITETGYVEGKIGYEMKGNYGFGYDPIFLLPERGLHLAEVPPEEKNKISHRAKALEKIKLHLDGLKWRAKF